MLSVRGRETSFDRAVYEGFNAALKRRKKAPFRFVNVEAIFNEVRLEADEYGDIVWKRLETAGIVGSREEFEEITESSEEDREQFALAWLKYKKRDAADAGIDRRWTEGLARMGEHARAQGYGGIVLMIDEFLPVAGREVGARVHPRDQLAERGGGPYHRPAAGTHLSCLWRGSATSRSSSPTLMDESKIHEHLDHHAKRFEITKLQDVELRHIVKGRVLRPRHPEQVEAVVASLRERHEKVLPALLVSGGHRVHPRRVPVPPGAHRDAGGRHLAHAAGAFGVAPAVRTARVALSQPATGRVPARGLGVRGHLPPGGRGGQQEGGGHAGTSTTSTTRASSRPCRPCARTIPRSTRSAIARSTRS